MHGYGGPSTTTPSLWFLKQRRGIYTTTFQVFQVTKTEKLCDMWRGPRQNMEKASGLRKKSFLVANRCKTTRSKCHKHGEKLISELLFETNRAPEPTRKDTWHCFWPQTLSHIHQVSQMSGLIFVRWWICICASTTTLTSSDTIRYLVYFIYF